ncbi:MAG TPA: sigma-70 family RNA polymerase sigma factor [Polyangia bacterium]
MAPPTTPDAALVDRLRRGERAAFRDLYARFAQPSFGFLVRLAGRRDAAEDLHQEVWLSVATHAARLEPDTDLAAWIFTIARNRFRSARRHAAADAAAPASDPAALDARGAGPAASDDPGCRDLERALASLPEIHREVLLLAGVEGLDAKQLAGVLAISHDAARQRLARARAALAEALAGTDEIVSTATTATTNRKAIP